MDFKEMPEEQFWTAFSPVSGVKHHKIYKQEFRLKRELKKFTDQELIEFTITYDRFHQMANRWDLWEVAHHTCHTCSEQEFKNFRNWLIGRGQKAFHTALSNPDNLADYPLKEDFAAPKEAQWDVLPSQIWKKRKWSRSMQDWDNMLPTSDKQQTDPVGTPFDKVDAEGYKNRNPRLSALYSNTF